MIDDGRDGFTLLETLIAFMILSAALAISAQTISVATRSLMLSNERTEVLRLAENLRAKSLWSNRQSDKDFSGDDGHLHWKIATITPAMPGRGESRAAFSVVTILSRSGREHKFVYFETGGR